MSSSISHESAFQARPDTKVQQLCEHLREIARQLGPGVRLPSMRDLCQTLGTTRVTLGEALNVLEAQNVIYRKERSGIYVSPKYQRRSICVLFAASYVLPVGSSPVWGMLWAQLAAEAQRRATSKSEYYSFHLIMDAPPDTFSLPEDVVAMIQAGKVHAVMAIGLRDNDGLWIARQGIPQVAFAGVGHSAKIVILDQSALVRLAVEQLALQGCSRIGYWQPRNVSNEDVVSLPHLDPVFQQSLDQAGLPFYPELVSFSCSARGESLTAQELGYQLALDIFGNPAAPRPDGIIIDNDMVTDGALAAFDHLGIHAGKDIKIATHANAGSTVLFGHLRNITAIEYDPIEFAQAMFRSLDELLYEGLTEPGIVMVRPRLRS